MYPTLKDKFFPCIEFEFHKEKNKYEINVAGDSDLVEPEIHFFLSWIQDNIKNKRPVGSYSQWNIPGFNFLCVLKREKRQTFKAVFLKQECFEDLYLKMAQEMADRLERERMTKRILTTAESEWCDMTIEILRTRPFDSEFQVEFKHQILELGFKHLNQRKRQMTAASEE